MTTFHFTGFHPPTDKINFSKITSVLGQLKKLCLINYMVETPYELNFQCVIDLMKRNKSTLKHVHFFTRNINDQIIQSIGCIEDLNLRSFSLKICENVTDSGLQKLFESQKNISCLDLTSCRKITNQSLAMICQNLPRITSLKMSGCSGITKVSLIFTAKTFSLFVKLIFL